MKWTKKRRVKVLKHLVRFGYSVSVPVVVVAVFFSGMFFLLMNLVQITKPPTEETKTIGLRWNNNCCFSLFLFINLLVSFHYISRSSSKFHSVCFGVHLLIRFFFALNQRNSSETAKNMKNDENDLFLFSFEINSVWQR